MRFMRLGIWLVVAVLAMAGVARAQSTTGTISGRVVDTQDRTVPGVTVSVESPNLQGIRTAVTSENGDYIFTLLPSGPYTITFELSGFERQQRTVTVAPTQIAARRRDDGACRRVGNGRSRRTRRRRAHADGSGGDELHAGTDRQPSDEPRHQRDAAARAVGASDRARAATTRSPARCRSRTCSWSTASRSTRTSAASAFNLYIEDAIQETTVATAGISAEYGRFGGGVVNVITKSGGNQFTGSFRDTLNNDDWRDAGAEARRATCSPTTPSSTRSSRPTSTPSAGRSCRDRLWFFTAGRFQTQELAATPRVTNIPVHRHATSRSASRARAPTRSTRTTGSRARSSRKRWTS